MCRYPPSTIHRYLDLPSTQIIQTHTSHRHNTTPPLPTLVQAPYPLPIYTTHTTYNTGTRILFLKSSEMQLSLIMLLIRSVIHLAPKIPDAFIISLTTPVVPAAFPIFNHLIAAATISSKMRQQGPITSGQSTSLSQACSTFRSFSIFLYGWEMFNYSKLYVNALFNNSLFIYI